ncbi:BnaA08g29570D [Brassica napus]|uniref:BnaA08g29570D protein n=1 Tax=Brassica napus TaxID=3708 RepID=A0A078JJE8_BRANA|nr:BnaA08g29570D [Brassica napus]
MVENLSLINHLKKSFLTIMFNVFVFSPCQKEDLHQLAYEANAVKTIVDILKTESELHPKRLQGLFQSLAELSSKLEDCRCTFLSLQVLDLLFDALRHKNADVSVKL